MLQNHGKYLTGKLHLLGPKITGELAQIIKSGNRTNRGAVAKHDVGEDLFRQLDELPLEVLSGYIDSEVGALHSARADLSHRRSKGAHKVSEKAQNFVIEFDRFLKAYSGIVDVLTSVDAQYGGVASTTLSLLFAVGFLNTSTCIMRSMSKTYQRCSRRQS